MTATGLFAMVWAFLLWVAGRAATVTLENNGGILMKLAVTVFGFVGLYHFNLSGSLATELSRGSYRVGPLDPYSH